MSQNEYTPIEVINRPDSSYIETRIKCPCGRRGFAPLIITWDTIVMCPLTHDSKKGNHCQCAMQRKDNYHLVCQMIERRGVNSKWGKILTVDVNISLTSVIDGKIAPVVAALKFPHADCPFGQYCWNKKPLDLGITPPPDSFDPKFKDLPEIKPVISEDDPSEKPQTNSPVEKPAA